MKKIFSYFIGGLLGLGIISSGILLFFNVIASPDRPNIILISLDTLRADRLSCYGYQKHNTPNLDDLARKNVLFTWAFTQFPGTLVSHMTLMTSVYSSVHGQIQPQTRAETIRYVNTLNSALKPLAEFLRELDYYTIGITEGGYVAGAKGFDRGFEEYYDKRFDVKKIFSRAADWLRENRNKRFFMFLHTYESHVPYDPPEEFLPQLASEYSWEHKMIETQTYQDRKKKGEVELDPTSSSFIEKVNSLYDGEVLFIDREMGRLIETLQELDLYNDLLLIIFSDHGESLGERDEFSHGKGAFGHGRIGENNMHIPLIIKFPAKSKVSQPRVVQSPVGLIDILPTIVDLLQECYPAQSLQGMSLLPLLEDETGKSRLVFSEFSIGAMARDEKFKYIRFDKGEEFLYDIEEDPGEEENLLSFSLSGEEDKAYRKLKKHISQLCSKNEKLRERYGPIRKEKAVPVDKAELRALGYL